MRPKIDIYKLKHLPTTEDMFVDEYGAKGTASRDEFDAKSVPCKNTTRTKHAGNFTCHSFIYTKVQSKSPKYP